MLPCASREANVILRNPKILLAEEDPDLHWLYCQWLESAGFEVIEASDPEWINFRLEYDTPDCMLIDLDSACSSVIDRCKRRRILMGDQPIPLIATTTHWDSGMNALAGKSWLNTVLLKPFNRTELLQAIQKVIDPIYRSDCDERLETRISQLKRSAWNRLRNCQPRGQASA